MRTQVIIIVLGLCLTLPACNRSPPSADAYKKLLPNLISAETVFILCWPPQGTNTPDDFTQAAADGLAERLRSEGFRPKALSDATADSNATQVKKVETFHTQSEIEFIDFKRADVTIHIRMDDHVFKGVFGQNKSTIETNYHATLWVCGNDFKTPFKINWSGSGGETSETDESKSDATPPSWIDFNYPEDEDERLNAFAKKCGAETLDGVNNFSNGPVTISK